MILPNHRSIITGLTISAVCFLIVFIGLWMLSQPPNAKARLAEVQVRLESAEKASSTRGDLSQYPPKVLCSNAEASTLATLRSALDGAAMKAGVTLSTNRISLPQILVADGLIPLNLKIEAQGAEPGLLTFLKLVATQQPSVFIDAVDLNSDGQLVYLNLKGRFLCASRPRL